MKTEVKVGFFGMKPCPKCGRIMSDEDRYCDECITEALGDD